MAQSADTAWYDITKTTHVSQVSGEQATNYGSNLIQINADGAQYDSDGNGSREYVANDERIGLIGFQIQPTGFYGLPDDAILTNVTVRLHVDFSYPLTSAEGSGCQLQLHHALTKYDVWVQGSATFAKYTGSVADTWSPLLASAAVYDGTLGATVNVNDDDEYFNFPCPLGVTEHKWDFGTTATAFIYAMNAQRVFVDHGASSDPPQYKLTWVQPNSIPPIINMVGNGSSGIIRQKTITPDTTTTKLYIISNTTGGLSAATSGSHVFSTTDYAVEDILTSSLSGTQIEDVGQGNQTYYYRAFISGAVNTDAYASGSNELRGTRPPVPACTFSGFDDVGDEGTMTVACTTGDWRDYGSGKIKYLHVNWDGAAAGELIEDASKIEYIDEDHTLTRKHIYTASGAKNVWVAVEDTLGFISDYTKFTHINITPDAKIPIALMTFSKRTTLNNEDGLVDETNTLNGIRSVSGDSGSEIYHYKWKHDAGSPLVNFHATDNKNSNLEEQSDRLTVRCNWGSDSSVSKPNDDAVLTVWGMGSFTSSGTPIQDTHSTFSHYQYCKDTMSPKAVKWVYASATDSGANGRHTENYFKRIDMIMITTESDQDVTAYPAFYEIVTKTGSKMINPRLSATVDSYRASGYAETDPLNCVLRRSYDDLTRPAGSWLEEGFHTGDVVHLGMASTTSMNGYYKIASLNDTVITFEDDMGSGDLTEHVTLRVDSRRLVGVTYAVTNDANSQIDMTLAVSQDQIPANGSTSSSVWNTTEKALYTRLKKTFNIDTEVTNSNLAISNVKYNRTGGMTPKMTLGDRIYPIGTIRTTQGLPTLDLTLTALNQTGLRNLFSLAEGITYDYCYIKSNKIDDPTLPIRTFIVKVMSIGLDRTPDKSKFYSAVIKFVIIGESV